MVSLEDQMSYNSLILIFWSVQYDIVQDATQLLETAESQQE